MMIDIHAHILPGLDDGPQTMAESIAMCKIAYEDGIHTIIATPHTLDGLYVNSRETIQEGVTRLKAALNKAEIPLEILPGAEVHACIELAELYAAGKIQTMNNSRYLLVEFPTSGIPAGFDETFFRLKVHGAKVIIAHPERNLGFQRNPNLLVDYVNNGALSQITAGSLTGRFGRRVKESAEKLLQHGCVHFIASDGHSINNRPVKITRATKAAMRLTGSAHAAAALVGTNSLSVVNNNEIKKVASTPINTKRKFFGLAI